MTKGRDYSVYVMDWKEAVLVTIISACICMFAGLLFFRNVFAAFIFLGGVIFMRRAYCMHMLDVRQAKMLSQFQDLLHSLSGHHIHIFGALCCRSIQRSWFIVFGRVSRIARMGCNLDMIDTFVFFFNRLSLFI